MPFTGTEINLEDNMELSTDFAPLHVKINNR